MKLLFLIASISLFCEDTMAFRSPWLEFERPTWSSLDGDLNCDVAIIGGGISGVATLYSLLTETDKNVVLIEKTRIASGATGNNAGIVVPNMERPASELMEHFGEEITKRTRDELYGALEYIQKINEQIGQEITHFPYAAFGLSSVDLLTGFVYENKLQTKWNDSYGQFLVSETVRDQVPEEIQSDVKFVPHETVLSALRVVDPEYIAVLVRKLPLKGFRMNSAEFCYKALDYLQKQYPDRFRVYEETEISTIHLHPNHQELTHGKGRIHSKDLILCTNGYMNFSIFHGDQPFTKLHDAIDVRGSYMAAFQSPSPQVFALGLMKEIEGCPYWYYSQAPATPGGPNLSLIGGPEFPYHEDTSLEEVGKEHLQIIKDFLHQTFDPEPKQLSHYWHGRMAFTETGLRWIGSEPTYPHLWYNLGCNGIGIVPAFVGAKHIAHAMNGKALAPTLFSLLTENDDPRQ